MRVKDNVLQAAIVIGCTLLGAAIGWLVNRGIGAAIGGVCAMLVSTFLSGVVLMVLGWVRATSRRKRRYGLLNQACARCGYDLRGLQTPQCPECGKLQV